VPRAGLAPASVVAAGAALVDEVGFGGLTMGLLAKRVGVRPPSLYKHIASLDALHRGIAVQARRELNDVLARAAAGKSGPDAVRAFAAAWRGWTLAHPGRCVAALRAPTADDDEEDRRVANEGLRLMYDVLAGFGLDHTRALDAARVLRSALHGFVALESGGGFGLPRDIDRSFNFLLETLISGYQADCPAAPEEPEAGRPLTHDV
jgi:AcrR family transcriptional regulator